AVRITTNIVGVEPDDVAIGMSVRVVFEQRDDVWVPLFEPDPPTTDTPTPDTPTAEAVAQPMVPSRDLERPPSPMRHISRDDKFESRVVISGIGTSAIGRRLGRDPLGLMVDAVL